MEVLERLPLSEKELFHVMFLIENKKIVTKAFKLFTDQQIVDALLGILARNGNDLLF